MLRIPAAQKETSPAVRAALIHPGYRWRQVATTHMDLYIQPETAADQYRDQLSRTAEAALTDDLKLIEFNGTYPDRLSLVFVTSREQMRELIGQPNGGRALVGAEEGHAAFFVSADGRAALRHELMHLITFRLWGEPSSSWIVEGTGTFAGVRCAGYSFRALAARLQVEKRLPSIAELTANFHGIDDLHSYIASASLVAFLRERHGVGILRDTWKLGLPSALKKSGTSADSFEADWQDYLARSDSVAPERAWQDIITQGCE